MKNKEVLFVSNFFGDGGAARVISVLAEELANRGYAVTVCSYPRKDREEYRRAANVKYVRFEMKHRKGVLYKIERNGHCFRVFYEYANRRGHGGAGESADYFGAE